MPFCFYRSHRSSPTTRPVMTALNRWDPRLLNITYLRRLPVEYLKIDGELTGELAVSPAKRHMIPAVVSLASVFDLRTIAEGV